MESLSAVIGFVGQFPWWLGLAWLLFLFFFWFVWWPKKASTQSMLVSILCAVIGSLLSLFQSAAAWVHNLFDWRWILVAGAVIAGGYLLKAQSWPSARMGKALGALFVVALLPSLGQGIALVSVGLLVASLLGTLWGALTSKAVDVGPVSEPVESPDRQVPTETAELHARLSQPDALDGADKYTRE